VPAPKARGTNGDGLTRYEEHRASMCLPGATHARAQARTKDLFMSRENAGYGAADLFNLATTHWVRPDEMNGRFHDDEDGAGNGVAIGGTAGFVEFAPQNNTTTTVLSEDAEWQFKVKEINGDTTVSWIDANAPGQRPNTDTDKEKWLRLYTILDSPQAPWDAGDTGGDDKKQPWARALRWACDSSWAGGAAGVTAAASGNTSGINGCGKFEYQSGSHYVDGADGKFKLKECLDDLDAAGKEKVNCTDCATMVMLFSNLVGAQLWASRMGDNFDCNEIIAIGAAGWAKPPGGGYSYHEVGWTGACGDADKVFDPCLKVDGNGDPSVAPRTPKLPTDMQFSDGGQGAPYVYRESLAKPGVDGYDKCLAKPGTKKRREPK